MIVKADNYFLLRFICSKQLHKELIEAIAKMKTNQMRNNQHLNNPQMQKKSVPSRDRVKQNFIPSRTPSKDPERQSLSKPKMRKVSSNGLFKEAHVVHGQTYLKNPSSLISSSQNQGKNMISVKSNEQLSLARTNSYGKLNIKKQVDINIGNIGGEVVDNNQLPTEVSWRALSNPFEISQLEPILEGKRDMINSRSKNEEEIKAILAEMGVGK